MRPIKGKLFLPGQDNKFYIWPRQRPTFQATQKYKIYIGPDNHLAKSLPLKKVDSSNALLKKMGGVTIPYVKSSAFPSQNGLVNIFQLDKDFINHILSEVFQGRIAAPKMSLILYSTHILIVVRKGTYP